MLPAEYTFREALATWCNNNLSQDENFLRRIIFIYECIFHVSRIENTENSRILDTKNPRGYRQHEAHSKE